MGKLDIPLAIQHQVYADELRNLFKNIAVSIFKWEGLPKGVKSERLERQLYLGGSVVFFEHETLGFVTLPHTNEGLNHYGEPVQFRPVAIGEEAGNMPLLHLDECVRIKNNDGATPDDRLVDYFIAHIVDIDFAINANRQAIKTPIMFQGDAETTRSIKTIARKITNNEPFIIKNKEFGAVFDVDVPQVAYMGDKLILQKHDFKNELFAFLGVNNANQDKKERLVVDEVNANNDQVAFMMKSRLEQRQEACKAINEMYGLNVSVRFNQDEEEEEAKETEDIKEEGEDYAE